MEKIVKEDSQNKNAMESILLNNRKYLKLEGIVEVISTSDTAINLKLKDTSLFISGEQISILKLDINSGILEAEGKFALIKFGKSGNFLKRLFKWK